MKQAPRIWVLMALLTFQLTWVSGAAPQQYPTRPITLIVPFAPGGPVDTLARPVASSMAKSLKQTLIIDDIGGASGSIGVARAAKKGRGPAELTRFI